MNYLKTIAAALSASTLDFRRAPHTSRRSPTLSPAELRRIVAEALG